MMNDRDQVRARLSQAACEAISGQRDLLSACRIIAQGRHAAGLDASGALDYIVAIESELDDSPREGVRDIWSDAVYAEKQREKEEYLVLVRDALIESLHCIFEEL